MICNGALHGEEGTSHQGGDSSGHTQAHPVSSHPGSEWRRRGRPAPCHHRRYQLARELQQNLRTDMYSDSDSDPDSGSEFEKSFQPHPATVKQRRIACPRGTSELRKHAKAYDRHTTYVAQHFHTSHSRQSLMQHSTPGEYVTMCIKSKCSSQDGDSR